MIDESLRGHSIKWFTQRLPLCWPITEMDFFVGIIVDMDIMASISRKNDLDQKTVSQSMTACELITARGAKKTPCVHLDATETGDNAIGVMEGVKCVLLPV